MACRRLLLGAWVSIVALAGCGATTSGSPSSTVLGHQATGTTTDSAKPNPATISSVSKPDPGYNWTDSPADIEQWRRENLVGQVAERLVPEPERPGIGYAGLKVSGDQLRVWLWWKGPVPPGVRAVADDSTDGVDVEIAPAPYNHTELQAGISRVLPSGPADSRLTQQGVKVLGVGPVLEGTGLWVTYDRSVPGLVDHARAQRVLEDVAGIPVIEAQAKLDCVVREPLKLSSTGGSEKPRPGCVVTELPR